MTLPKIDTRISLGNILTMISMGVVAVLAFAELQAADQKLSAEIQILRAQVEGDIGRTESTHAVEIKAIHKEVTDLRLDLDAFMRDVRRYMMNLNTGGR